MRTSRSSGRWRARTVVVVFLLSSVPWLLIGFVSFAHTLWIGLVDASGAARLSIIEWGPWIVLSPLVVLFVSFVPITGANWKWAFPLHCAVSVGVALAIYGLTLGISRRSLGPSRNDPFTMDSQPAPPNGPALTPPGSGGPRLSRVGPVPVRPGMGMGGMLREGAPLPRTAPVTSIMLLNARFTLPIYWLIALAVLAWQHHRIALDGEGRAVRAEREAVRARLAALQAQLQPHFLFNSLNAISAFIRQRPAAAEEMVCALSNLLRSILHMSERPEIPLHEELEFARGYLAVHRIRFEDTLRVSWHIDPNTSQAVVPTLLLQPFIENALEHGLRGAAGEITIGAEARRQRLVLFVTDRADQQPPEGGAVHEGTRTGLRNTRERLQTLFGSNYRLDLINLPDGVRAEIELPLRTTI